MKKLISSIIALTFLSSISFAQIDLLIDYKTFFLPGEKPYIEFYLSLNGNTISYAEIEEGKFQGKLETTYIITDKKDSIIGFEKFISLSPIYSEESDFLEIFELKRFPLDNGEYNFEFLVKDLNNGKVGENKVKLKPFEYNDNKIQFSDLILAYDVTETNESSLINKNGVGINPNLGYLFKTTNEKLGFYVEIYNANKELGENEDYLFEYSISIADKESVFNNISGFQKVTANNVSPIANLIDIKSLPSGNYDFKVICKNRQNEVILEKKQRFQRSNRELQDLKLIDANSSFVSKITNIDQLKEFIMSTIPISSSKEFEFAKNQMEYSDLKFMQQYFLNFWNNRNPLNPEKEWIKYKREVDIAQEKFGYGGIRGYQTERGRVYLQYGKPNAVQNVSFEPNTYPYSVWQYYKLNGLSNRKFLFYSPSMEMLGYKLLDSNVPGEITNPNWQAELENKTKNRGNTYELKDGEILNDRAKDLYDNPR